MLKGHIIGFISMKPNIVVEVDILQYLICF